MKKRYFSFIALSMVFIMLLMATGCGVRVNGKEYEFFKSGQNEKNNILGGIGEQITNDQEIIQDNLGGDELEVSSNAGNIDIAKSDDSKIEIKVDKKVRGASSQTKKLILDNLIVSLENSGNENKIVVKTKDGKDFWEWQQDHHKAYQVTLNFDIKLPDKIKVINANTGAGNIDIVDVSAELSLSTGAGNVNINNTSAYGVCKLSTGAGNIEFEGNIDKADSFDASTGVGNVKFEVPEATKMSLDAGTGVGVLNGSFIETDDSNKFHFQGDINGGGTKVKLSTGVGNVKADNN
ncbi:MAG: hypothetical protein K0R50_2688 [Eubacterium sp.]|nr:hypothetical protein [Eubacterium sp.]